MGAYTKVPEIFLDQAPHSRAQLPAWILSRMNKAVKLKPTFAINTLGYWRCHKCGMSTKEFGRYQVGVNLQERSQCCRQLNWRGKITHVCWNLDDKHHKLQMLDMGM